jgi:hypothetical protein
LHLSIFYEYQQFLQHRICFLIQLQLQLVNVYRNRRYFVIKLHTWFLCTFCDFENDMHLKMKLDKIWCRLLYQHGSFQIINKIYFLNNIFRKNWWNALIWVTGHCNREAVSRNRYGVEKTVDTHKLLIKAIKCYACFQEI